MDSIPKMPCVALHCTVPSWGNDPRSVRLLLERGANPNARLKDDTTPLHLALEHGKIEIGCLLVEHGASVEAEDDMGRTPLDFVSREQSDGIIELLLEHRGQTRERCTM
jgi:ankyrin repeat protein